MAGGCCTGHTRVLHASGTCESLPCPPTDVVHLEEPDSGGSNTPEPEEGAEVGPGSGSPMRATPPLQSPPPVTP